MQSGDLVITKIFPELTQGCCTNKVYAVIHGNSGSLKLLESGSYALSQYSQSQHSSFCIVMSEIDERPGTYRAVISKQYLSLPVSSDGQKYTVEYRRRTAGDQLFSRSEDSFLGYDSWFWTGEAMSASFVSASESDRSSSYEASFGFSYDSELDKIRCIAFLKKNGEIVDGSKRCEVKWVERNGNLISNSSSSTHIAGMPGFFQLEFSGAELTPDESSAILVSITGPDNVIHKSGTVSVTWD